MEIDYGRTKPFSGGLSMIIKGTNSSFRKTIPVYERINPIKLMNFTKILSDLCHIRCTCQILTRNHENTWIFKYKANNTFYITLSFRDKKTESCAYATIHDFIFPPAYTHQKLDDKILNILIKHIQHLDFEMLIFQIKHSVHISLCKKYGFKPFRFNEMALSLKPKFIPTTKAT